MPGLTSAFGLIGLLDEPDQQLKCYALQNLDKLVDQFWAEIADSVSKIEVLYEDDQFSERNLAALVASKVYYHLGEYDESMMFALGAGDLFDITAKSEYVETIISKCIDKYIVINSHNDSLSSATGSSNIDDPSFAVSGTKKDAQSVVPQKADPRLQDIVERMFRKCYETEDYKPAIGIAIEARRLDVVEEGINLASRRSKDKKGKEKSSEEEKDGGVELMEYVLEISMNVVQEIGLREKLLRLLVNLFLSQGSPDYFSISKCVIHLNDTSLAAKILQELVQKEDSKSLLVAYQIAFDLDSSAAQEFLQKVANDLPGPEADESDALSTAATAGGDTMATDTEDDENTKLLGGNASSAGSISGKTSKYYRSIRQILRGTKSIEIALEFLFRNNHTDMSILNKIKDSLEARNSIFHTAVTFSNAFMNAGTTSDGFFRANLEWLSKAVNWSKFTATAALGVIHRGNLSQGLKLLEPYLPQEGVSTGSPYSQGGSLYALGLIYANHGTDVLDFLRKQFKGTSDEMVQHGGALGLGVAGMATGNQGIYDDLKEVLWSDSAIAGEAVGLAMGLVMLGTGSSASLEDMVQYAHDTQHEKIIRGLAIGMALIMFGKQEAADDLINTLLDDPDPTLRYGGIMTIAMAYCGTGSNKAIRQLLHVAVSDVNDDVRRVSVMSLGFILFRKPNAVPRMVELLSESYNPHVRYGASLALGISCAGTGLDEAIDLLEPMIKDPTDFVRQGALISMAMILVQQNDQMNPKVASLRKTFEGMVGEKHEDAMAKFGAALALGIIDAGGRNVTIGLQTQTGSLNLPAIVGMAVFTQYWYWFPLTHFLSLSFMPTGLIGLDDELNVPDFKFWSNTRPSLFDYPPKVEESTEKAPEKIATAVLSTTVKARQRAKRSEKEKAAKEAAAKGEDAMETDPVSTPVTPGPIAEGDDKMDLEDDSAERKEGEGEGEKREEGEKKKRAEKEKVGYELGNMSRVLPEQLKYISFTSDGRYEPVKKPTGGILLLLDRTPSEPVKLMELKARKATAPTTTGPGHTVGSANDGPGTGGAAAAVNVLNTEDDEGDEDAPPPDDFEYITDGETEEEL
ncbi:armadillo-type protein [Tuber borchii]|uniref:26S proteasome regulatory subunit RPN2 n=1 Tax=Tuber borchii TaxID=42251 RepID=A0A2T6ZNI4_TUBBO|nr:armadillo-type protein [Tuber borchii]